MFQTICKAMLIVPLLFAGALMVVHAQPARDDVRPFLLTFGTCAIPCWQGIQPGVTTVDQAKTLLSANPWVTTVRVVDNPPLTYLYWQWSAQKPTFAGDPHLLIPPLMWAENGIVQMIFIPTGLSYGEVSLLLGAPMHGSFETSAAPTSPGLAGRLNSRHVAAYFGGQINFDVQVLCPFNLDRFWDTPVIITYVSTNLTHAQPATVGDDLPHWLYGQPCA